MSDFRIVEYDKDFNIKVNKKKYAAEFKSKHKQAKNHYRYVSKSVERDYFGEIVYNCKCAYCGVDKTIQGASNYEIDHFLNQANHKFVKDIDEIDNLIYSCRECNQNKKAFIIPVDYDEILNPDYEIYGCVFERDSNDRIIISEKYENDKIVIAFYDKLKLGDERRRIDFALMKLGKFLTKKKEESDGVPISDDYMTVLLLYNNMRNERNSKIWFSA